MGVGMFTTETQMTETKKQQLETHIREYLRHIDNVDDARVILNLPRTRNYVMMDVRETPSASVAVSLRPGQSLSRQQISGISSFVAFAVGIDEDNVSVNDGNGIRLIASDGPDVWEEVGVEIMKISAQSDLRKMIANDTMSAAGAFLNTVLGPENFSIGVGAELSFTEGETIEDVTFTPVVGDAGIVRETIEQFAAGGIDNIGDVVGTWGNSDIAPGYPTVPNIDGNSDSYIEWQNRRTYEINERRTFFENKGLRISDISVALVINQAEELGAAEIAQWQRLLAAAANTTPDKVEVMARAFPPQPTPGPSGARAPGEAVRDVLIWIIIILGILLIALFVLALLTSGRKKRHIRYRGAVPVADGMGGYLRDDSFQPIPSEPEGFDLPSLLDENETKDVVLKREIKEFSKSNPEIIAQLIRTWFREEEIT
jgi:flagellar M-ring protein FliF